MKLHIGCGEKYLPGWKHLDARKFPHVDYVTDKLDKLDMFADNSLEEIYACHVLEHFPRIAMLRGGGITRVASCFKIRWRFKNCCAEFRGDC